MKILENKAILSKSVETPLKVRCPHCDSLLLIEEGDYRKRYDWVYTSDRKRQRCYCYVADCPCCKKEFRLKDYENI